MTSASFETISQELITPDMDQELALNALIGLRTRYQEPWRRYHVFEHPLELFDLLDRFRDEVDDPLSIGWSFMYHDAVYDPSLDLKTGMSEERSAQLSESEIPTFAPLSLANRVASLTRATFTHNVDPEDKDANFFMDADLAILGSPPERYDQYVSGVRFEFSGIVDPEVFRLGRITVLNSLATRIDGSGLFRTDIFRENFEAQAQANITRELTGLQERSG